MSDLDRDLTEALRSSGQFDPEQAKVLRKETVRMFDRNLTVAKWVTVGFVVFFAVIMVVGARGLLVSGTTRSMVISAMVVLLGGQGQVLVKLWYWTVNTKLNILKELKELQLQVAELSSKKQTE